MVRNESLGFLISNVVKAILDLDRHTQRRINSDNF